MFVNRWQITKIVFGIILLVCLCTINHLHGTEKANIRNTYRAACIKDYEPCRNIALTLHGRLSRHDNRSFSIFVRERRGKNLSSFNTKYPLSAVGAIEGIPLNRDVEFVGKFVEKGEFFVTKHRQYGWKQSLFKYLISIFGLILGLEIFISRYKLSRKGRLPIVYR